LKPDEYQRSAEQELTTSPAAGDEFQALDSDRVPGFDEQLDAALRYAKIGDRQSADRIFRTLLMEVSASPDYLENFVYLVPRAADFYSGGGEISVDQVEDLYRDAIIAILNVYGEGHYDHENVYRGLEKHYKSQGRYNDAAAQTSLLLEFYRGYFSDDEDMQRALIKPTTIRLVTIYWQRETGSRLNKPVGLP